MNYTLNFENKVVVVTGGGSGIGRETAIAFAKCGATAVVVVDINNASSYETVQMIYTQPRTKYACRQTPKF